MPDEPTTYSESTPTSNGLTPLQIATNNNHTEIVEFLSQVLKVKRRWKMSKNQWEIIEFTYSQL